MFKFAMTIAEPENSAEITLPPPQTSDPVRVKLAAGILLACIFLGCEVAPFVLLMLAIRQLRFTWSCADLSQDITCFMMAFGVLGSWLSESWFVQVLTCDASTEHQTLKLSVEIL